MQKMKVKFTIYLYKQKFQQQDINNILKSLWIQAKW
jgi:hypothetical protein